MNDCVVCSHIMYAILHRDSRTQKHPNHALFENRRKTFALFVCLFCRSFSYNELGKGIYHILQKKKTERAENTKKI